jgi:ABC-2 type transport system permease protein
MKLWHKKATWIMVCLLIIILIGAAGITKWTQSNFEQHENSPSWEEGLAENKAYVTTQLADPNIDDATKKQLEENLAITEYQLDQNIKPIDFGSREQYLLSSYGMLYMVILLAVIVAAGIVASEFSQGTIKMLLSRPVKRRKILTSKYVTTLLYALMLTVLTVVTTAIAGYLFFDPSGSPLLDYDNGSVVEASYWGRILTLYGLQFVSVMVFTTFAFMIGSVFRSSSLAIGLSIFLLSAGPNIVGILSKYEIAKYIIFSNDLTQYVTGTPS